MSRFLGGFHDASIPTMSADELEQVDFFTESGTLLQNHWSMTDVT